jgi:hypothetical protein
MCLGPGVIALLLSEFGVALNASHPAHAILTPKFHWIYTPHVNINISKCHKMLPPKINDKIQHSS